METTPNCGKCNKSGIDFQLFTCGHILCSHCTARLLFFEYFNELLTQDSFQITCNCKSGTKDFSSVNMTQLLSFSDDATGKSEGEQVTSNEALELMRQIEDIATNFQKKFLSSFDSVVKRFDCLLKQIEDVKEIFVSKMNKARENGDKIVNMIKLIYSDYLRNIATIEQSMSSSVRYELTGLDLQDETESMIAQIHEKLNGLKEYCNSFTQPIRVNWKIVPWVNTLTLTGHSSDVYSLIRMKDGRFASGSYDKKIKIWEVNDKDIKNTITFQGHHSYVWCLLSLQDGRIASGSGDNTIKIWGVTEKDYSNRMILTGHKSSVLSLIQLKDGRLASGACPEIKIWEITEKDFKNTMTLTGHFLYVNSLIQLKDDRIVSGSCDNTIKVWEITDNTFKNTITITGHSDPVYSLIQLTDGRVVSGSGDCTIKVWEIGIQDFKNTLTLTGHCQRVYSIIQLKDDLIASGSGDRTIQVWELSQKDFKNILTLTGHSDSVVSLLDLKDGRFVSGSQDKSIKVWDQQTSLGKIVHIK